jgi:hypothetical protein
VLPFLAGTSIGPSQAKRELSLVPRFFEPDFLALIVAVSFALSWRRLRAVPSPVQSIRAVDPPCRLTIRQPDRVSNKNGVMGGKRKTAGHQARPFPRSFGSAAVSRGACRAAAAAS